MLCEAAWIAVRTPGPLRAFYERLRARRGTQIALVATARKLCVLFWHLLTREQDYAFGRPSLTRHKLRRLELMAGDPPRRGQRSGSPASKRAAPRTRALRAVRGGLPPARRGLATEADEEWCGRDTGTRILKASIKSQAARQGQVPDPAL
jgi:hypothetical protein